VTGRAKIRRDENASGHFAQDDKLRRYKKRNVRKGRKKDKDEGKGKEGTFPHKPRVSEKNDNMKASATAATN
jgi:hypothetical protein